MANTFVFPFLILAAPAWAQEPGDSPRPVPAFEHNISFENLTVEDGLSHNCTTGILQDSRGFMWFGTVNGLNKYDGSDFTTYSHDPDNPKS
ncbi:MAG: two-component regulator propeller domain-containing protein, partial [Planctomycetota bacterium]|nr:two-component regulator propeller domain-containing protein [Planctomycetota bacterium]